MSKSVSLTLAAVKRLSSKRKYNKWRSSSNSFDLRIDNPMSLHRIVGADQRSDINQIALYPAFKLHVFSTSSIHVLFMTIFIFLFYSIEPPMWANVFDPCMRWSSQPLFPNTFILAWFHFIFHNLRTLFIWLYLTPSSCAYVFGMCCCINTPI